MRRASNSTCTGIIALALLSLTACRQGELEAPRIVQRFPVEDSSATSLWFTAGGLYVAGDRAVIRLDSEGSPLGSIPVRGSAGGVELLGNSEEGVYLRIGNGFALLEPGADSLRSHPATEDADAVLLDSRGRFIYESAADGAITAYHPETLEPIWGWAAVGGASQGISLSPQGDRFYQAVNGDGGAMLLVRDLQTGRVLREVELGDEVSRIMTSRSGSVLVLQADEEDGDLSRWNWTGGTLVEGWRRSIPGIAASAETELIPTTSGRLLAVFTPENEEGLHIIDVETGESIRQLAGRARDVSPGADDQLFVLQAGEILQLVPTSQ